MNDWPGGGIFVGGILLMVLFGIDGMFEPIFVMFGGGILFIAIIFGGGCCWKFGGGCWKFGGGIEISGATKTLLLK